MKKEVYLVVEWDLTMDGKEYSLEEAEVIRCVTLDWEDFVDLLEDSTPDEVKILVADLISDRSGWLVKNWSLVGATDLSAADYIALHNAING